MSDDRSGDVAATYFAAARDDLNAAAKTLSNAIEGKPATLDERRDTLLSAQATAQIAFGRAVLALAAELRQGRGRH